MFFGIKVPMFVLYYKGSGFCSGYSGLLRRADAPKCACAPEFAHVCATKQSDTKSLSTNIETIPKNVLPILSNELKRVKQLKPKLDIVKKPENRVHELTDSNVSLTTLYDYSSLITRGAAQLTRDAGP